jgi:methanogenic corrinoid protein MtbC1
MTEKDTLDNLSSLIAELDEINALDLARQLISEGAAPLQIIDYSHRGMNEVGRRYEMGTYFISGLIMAGEIMQQLGQMVLPLIMDNQLGQEVGRIVIGTVEGDIHFIGKDIFKALVRGHGFAVHDLGVDVPPGHFLAAIHEFKPDIVGFSCLITTGLEAMRTTIAHLRANVPPELAPRAYLAGGRRMDPKAGKMTGADLWTADCMEGVRFCQRTVAAPLVQSA